jgi:hypothetical protein
MCNVWDVASIDVPSSLQNVTFKYQGCVTFKYNLTHPSNLKSIYLFPSPISPHLLHTPCFECLTIKYQFSMVF